jgi:hypothetical protein
MLSARELKILRAWHRYFYGKDYEEKFCRENHGQPVYINGTYRFCRMGNVILGNRYAILWLIDQCNRYGCEQLE